MRLRGVFDEQQAIAVRQRLQCRHVGKLSVQMHGQNGGVRGPMARSTLHGSTLKVCGSGSTGTSTRWLWLIARNVAMNVLAGTITSSPSRNTPNSR